jgi:hypothetical protein
VQELKTIKTNKMRVTANFEEFVTVLCAMVLNVMGNEYSEDRNSAGEIFQRILGEIGYMKKV